jgi:1-phosphatidylinositol phosphodiesterase
MGNVGSNVGINTEKKIKNLNKNWMDRIDDGTLISEMSIPGTHNSCANCSKWTGMGYVRCQSLSIYEQLMSGVRFLDIRCRHENESFIIYHGIFSLELNFTDVLNDCVTFLTENPSECLILCIREEEDPRNNNGKSFIETYVHYISQYFEYIYHSDNIPELRKIRKKIWIMQGDNVLLNSYPLYNSYLENNWTVANNKELENKINFVKNNLNRAAFSDKYSLYITLCSGAGFMFPPLDVCRHTNKIVLNYKSVKLGIVVFDFPSGEVLDHIISLNFREK